MYNFTASNIKCNENFGDIGVGRQVQKVSELNKWQFLARRLAIYQPIRSENFSLNSSRGLDFFGLYHTTDRWPGGAINLGP